MKYIIFAEIKEWMQEERYPIGQQYCPGIIKEGKVYVDKTALIYKLVKGGKYYFLARPRRFGKSLLLSTIETYFEGGIALSVLE